MGNALMTLAPDRAHSANGWRIDGGFAARRFNYEASTLRLGDVVGRITDRRVLSAERSNLLSGTAILMRPDFYPHGSTGHLDADTRVILEDIVAESEGVLAWAGHLDVPDESLLYLTTRPASASGRELAADIAEADRMDVQGGAGQIDAFDPSRRQEALSHREQLE